MSNCTTTKIKAAIMAVIQSTILNDLIILAATLKTIALTTNVNSPRVSILTGNVNNNKIGRRTAFNKPITKLAINADLKSFISNPFTSFDVISNASADKSQTRII